MSQRVEIAPGALLPPQQIVGRDALIALLFEELRTRSVALVAPRRMGKSTVLRKMEAEPAAGFVVRRYSLEEIRSVQAMVARVYEDARALVSTETTARRWADEVIRKLRGKVEVAGLAVELEHGDWRALLRAIFADLQAVAVEHQRVVVLAWDEFTWFLQHLVEDQRAEEAGELLALLRTLRQSPELNRVRMVYTGSIGLEEVLDRLQRANVTREPMNDVHREALGVLDPAGAQQLAEGLVLVGVPEGDPVLATAIATAGEGHPLFLHQIARSLRERGQWRVEAVAGAVAALLDDSQDPLELDDWIRRIAEYQPEKHKLIEAVLDRLSEGPATVDELCRATGADRGEVAEALRFLRRDLYVAKEGAVFRFQLDLLRRFWASYRGLA